VTFLLVLSRIDGIEPEQEEHQATYHDLNVIVPFTGKIRLATDFIDDFYIHLGYQKPDFKTVLDIFIQEGKVVEINDFPVEMEQKQSAIEHMRVNMRVR
jgi:hypothetical protein